MGKRGEGEGGWGRGGEWNGIIMWMEFLVYMFS